jgi:hypothetical protein
MAKSLVNTNARFGTMPVFLTALSTILGAILFLRFGWAVGTSEMLVNPEDLSEGYENPGNILFVGANRAKAIN